MRSTKGPIKCTFFEFQLLARKWTIFLLIFKPRVSFSINFASPFSVMTHNFSEILCFGQKEPIKVQILRFLSTLMKIYPIFYASFETTKSRFIQILLHWKCLSVSWKITPLYFSIYFSLYFGLKKSSRREIFGLVSNWMKIHQILYVIFETTSQFFFKLRITLQCQCHEYSYVLFGWNCTWFW